MTQRLDPSQPATTDCGTPPLPYWQVNVPSNQRTAECPPYLATACPKDVAILSTPDSEYTRLTWPEVVGLIRTNRLDLFRRVPSDLRMYLSYLYDTVQSHGSIMNFMLKERLGWPIGYRAAGQPFEDDSDVKVLLNDWPYGIDETIVHLVVWTKFDIAESFSGDLTEQAREEIELYVRKTFADMPQDQVVWFKNWKSLKSVEAVEHFHVLLYRPSPQLLAEVTGGGVKMQDLVKQAKM